MECALGRERGHRRDEVLMPRTFPNRQESTKLFYCSLPLYLGNKAKKEGHFKQKAKHFGGHNKATKATKNIQEI